MKTRNYDEISKFSNLRYLDQLDDYKVHEDDTDVRGWNIYDRAGIKFGEITNLAVDKSAMRTRYVVVELEDENVYQRDTNFFERIGEDIKDLFGDNNDRSVLIPVGMVDIDEEDSKVSVFDFDSTYVSSGPRFSYSNREYVRPELELATARYYTQTDDVEDSRNTYRKTTYNSDLPLEGILDKETFYNTPIFDRKRYRRSYADADSTTMAAPKTGA
ncbi:MAG: PRC-barrel domain-containing protein [Bacteroidota bacterium]